MRMRVGVGVALGPNGRGKSAFKRAIKPEIPFSD